MSKLFLFIYLFAFLLISSDSNSDSSSDSSSISISSDSSDIKVTLISTKPNTNHNKTTLINQKHHQTTIISKNEKKSIYNQKIKELNIKNLTKINNNTSKKITILKTETQQNKNEPISKNPETQQFSEIIRDLHEPKIETCELLNKNLRIGCFNLCLINNNLNEIICIYDKNGKNIFNVKQKKIIKPMKYIDINQFKNEILKIFNYYRGITAIEDTFKYNSILGKYSFKSPKSKNMNILKWDQGLSKMANEYLKNKCHKHHTTLTKNDFINFDNERPNTDNFKNEFEWNYISEYDNTRIWGWMSLIKINKTININNYNTIIDYLKSNIVQYWLTKTSNIFYNFNNNQCRISNNDNNNDINCIFFKRQIYGDICRIGCDYSFECNKYSNNILLTCYVYDIPKNILHKPFIDGDPCSDCLTDICATSDSFHEITKINAQAFCQCECGNVYDSCQTDDNCCGELSCVIEKDEYFGVCSEPIPKWSKPVIHISETQPNMDIDDDKNPEIISNYGDLHFGNKDIDNAKKKESKSIKIKINNILIIYVIILIYLL